MDCHPRYMCPLHEEERTTYGLESNNVIVISMKIKENNIWFAHID